MADGSIILYLIIIIIILLIVYRRIVKKNKRTVKKVDSMIRDMRGKSYDEIQKLFRVLEDLG